MIIFLDKYNLNDLDIFNIDTFTISKQLVLFSLFSFLKVISTFLPYASIIVTISRFTVYIRNGNYHLEPKVTRYYLVFDFYLVTFLFLQIL